MADNVTLNSGAGGATLATDDIGGVQFQRVKVTFGPDGTATDVNTGAAGLPVQDGGNSLTVDNNGTFAVQSAQSGTWTVQPGNTANTTAWKVDGSAVTQPVSASSLPLPTGASTAAKQPALGTAGTASADVITVQGIASMTALKVDGSAVTQPVSGTLTVQQSTASNLKVDLSGTAANATAIKVDGSAVTQPVSGTVTANAGSGTFTNQQSNVTADYDTGAGTQTTTMFGLAIPASGGAVAGGTSTNPIRTDTTGTTTQPVGGNISSGASDSGNPVKIGAVFNSTPPTVTNGQRVDLQTDANGFLKINLAAGAGSGGTSQTDKAAFTASTTAGTPIMGAMDDTSPSTLSENEVGIVRATTNRALHVNLRDASGNEVAVGGGTQYDEDAASVGAEKLTLAGAIRQDTIGSTTTTDGDYANLKVNNVGRLYTSATVDAALPTGSNVIGAVTQSGTWTVQPGNTPNSTPWLASISQGGNTATVSAAGALTVALPAGATVIAKAEDVASANADVGVPAMAVQKATPANTAGTDGDYEFLQMSAGRLWASATIDAALPAGTNAIGKLAANSGVTIGAVEIAASQTLSTVTTVSTVTGVTTLTGSGVAHDAVDSGNPHKIGAKAETSPKGVTLVSDGDRTDLYADSDGMLMVKLNTSGADIISERVSNTDGASTAFTNFAAVANTRNCITGITVFRTDSGTTPQYVDFRDGAAGSVLWSMPLPPNGGSTESWSTPAFRTSANTALAYDVSAALTSVIISVTGFQSKV